MLLHADLNEDLPRLACFPGNSGGRQFGIWLLAAADQGAPLIRTWCAQARMDLYQRAVAKNRMPGTGCQEPDAKIGAGTDGCRRWMPRDT